ncbi:L-tyrosine:2-oxoglutarate aminotransferase [Sparassis latifolia]
MASSSKVDLMHHLSAETLGRKPNPMKAIGRLIKPKMISLANGDPHFSFYPINKIQFEIASVDVKDPVASWRSASSDAPSCTLSSSRQSSQGLSLRNSLGYTNATGIPQAQQTLIDLTKHYHSPPDHMSVMTLGNGDAISKCFRLLANRGDNFLADEFTFTSSTNSGESFGINWVPVRIDSGGIMPDVLEKILSTWDPARGRRPHVLYIVPCGQNPTGSTLTLERRKEIYEIAQRFDLIIIEDDPYYFLRYPDPASDSDESFLPSFLSMDVDGRVIRLDSFSKIIAPGMRFGWVTCNPVFYEHLVSLTDSSTHHPHAFGQILVTELLSAHGWQLAGFDRWVRSLRDDYQRRRDFLLSLYARELGGTGYTTASAPAAGMFVWIRVNLERHTRFRSDVRVVGGDPAGPRTNVGPLMQELFESCLDAGLVVMPGFVFALRADPEYDDLDDPIEDRVNYVRVTFAGTEEIMEQGMSILGRVVKEFFACES